MNTSQIRKKLISYVNQRAQALKASHVQYDRQPKPEEMAALDTLTQLLEWHRHHGLNAHAAMVANHTQHLRALLPSERSRQKSWRKQIEEIISFCQEHYRQMKNVA
jgi:hypothetical protein